MSAVSLDKMIPHIYHPSIVKAVPCLCFGVWSSCLHARGNLYFRIVLVPLFGENQLWTVDVVDLLHGKRLNGLILFYSLINNLWWYSTVQQYFSTGNTQLYCTKM